jgi:hypothetical protein
MGWSLVFDSLSIRLSSTSSARWSMKFCIVNSRFRHAGQPGMTTLFLNLRPTFRAALGNLLLLAGVLFAFFPWHKHLQCDQSVLQCQLFFNVGGAFVSEPR